ncbi:hypothetical protein [Pseudomonas amygdali]|uniref:hypothetical protein n=1 Tax=Pseudomonas amygdali TaxID=47877 RepID=UPI0011C355AC|nr:hypothetical protein [Pseudomonas amygdali]
MKIINEVTRTCICGATTGVLADDELTATVTGPCQVLGLGSGSVRQAALTQTKLGDAGLRKLPSPAIQQLNELKKTDPELAMLMAASLPTSAFKGALKGRNVVAFVIPYKADTVIHDVLPDKDYNHSARTPYHGKKRVERKHEQAVD